MRRRARQWASWIALVVVLILAATERMGCLASQGSDTQQYNNKVFRVSRVVDGDTVYLDAYGQTIKVRLLGIDAPELHLQPVDAENNETSPGQPAYWAVKASEYLRNRALDQQVTVVLEPLDQRDRYGRLLAYLYLNESEMLNLEMIQQGQAYADRRFKHSYQRVFEQAETQAQRQKLGLWAKVQETQMPSWRQRWLQKQGN